MSKGTCKSLWRIKPNRVNIIRSWSIGHHLVRTIKFSLQRLVAVYYLKWQTKTVLPTAQYFNFVVFLAAATLFTYNMIKKH